MSDISIFDRHRNLEGSNDEYTSYLVDKNGNEYEPYSLAWRYLGMYIDCDIEEQDVDREQEGDERRFLSDDSNCERVLLWAAVRE